MTNSNLQGRSSRKIKTVLKGSSVISALKFGLSLVVFTVFLAACPQPAPAPTPTPDPTPSVTISETAITAVEEGAAGTYTVVLATAPTAMVTINVMEMVDNAAITVAPETLEFTTTNWSSAQTVTVTAVEDDNNVNERVTITHSVAANVGRYTTDITLPSVEVTTQDNDPGVRLSAAAITVAESGTGSYTVGLNTQPAMGTTVILTPTNSDSDVATVSPTDLYFTSVNWNMNLPTITITPVQDVAADDEMTMITYTASGTDAAYTGLTAVVVVNVNDDITPSGLIFDPIDRLFTVAENIAIGSPARRYTVKLSSQPSGPVTVTIAATGDTPRATFDTSVMEGDQDTPLTFTAVTWNIPMYVSVNPVDNNVDDGDATLTHTHTASGGGYDSVSGPRSVSGIVTLTITDDE